MRRKVILHSSFFIMNIRNLQPDHIENEDILRWLMKYIFVSGCNILNC